MYGLYGKISEDKCKTPCYGNNQQMCGGWWANSVYALTSPPSMCFLYLFFFILRKIQNKNK